MVFKDYYIIQHDSDWIVQRYILRKRGITITGPDLITLIAPVSPADQLWAVSDILCNWLRQFLDDQPSLSHLAINRTQSLLCAALYTYEHGEIVSKRNAAEWAIQSLGKERIGLINHAWSGRQTPGLVAQSENIDGTLEFIRYPLDPMSVSKVASTQY